VGACVTAHAAWASRPSRIADANVQSAARLATVLAATPSPVASAPAQSAYTVNTVELALGTTVKELVSGTSTGFCRDLSRSAGER
jgi:hypothetical protein